MVNVPCDGSHAKYFSNEDLRTKLAQIDKHHESMDPQIKDWYHDCYWPLAGNFDPTTQDGSHPCIL